MEGFLLCTGVGCLLPHICHHGPRYLCISAFSALSSNHKASSVSTQAMFELVTSEASYYKSLNLLVSHFMENERLKKILHPSEAHILFSNVLDVMAVSER